MKRFLHFDKTGKFTHDDLGAAGDKSVWVWDSYQNYLVKGDREYRVFTSNGEYFVGKFSTIPNKTHPGRIY